MVSILFNITVFTTTCLSGISSFVLNYAKLQSTAQTHFKIAIEGYLVLGQFQLRLMIAIVHIVSTEGHTDLI